MIFDKVFFKLNNHYRKSLEKNGKFFTIFMNILFLMLSVIFIFAGVSSAEFYKKGLGSANWFEHTGVITGSKYEIRKRTVYRGRYSEGIEQTYYRPTVNYKYELNGFHFLGIKTKAVGMEFYDEDEIKLFLKRYPKNKKVTIYVNPNNHGEAILIRPEKFGSDEVSLLVFTFALLAAGTAMFIYCILLYVYLVMKFFKRKEKSL